jgi:hypothetical protein
MVWIRDFLQLKGFIKYNSDIVSSSLLHPKVQVTLMVADAEATKVSGDAVVLA